MSRTWKKYPDGHYHRRPKGRKRAIINDVRKGAIPPDAWDDISFDNHCWISMKVAFGLHKKGWDDDRIIRHIREKFSLTQHSAQAIMPNPEAPYWHKCKCARCLDARRM